MFERLGEIEQNGERFKSEAEEPPVKFEEAYLVHWQLSFLFFIVKLLDQGADIIISWATTNPPTKKCIVVP